MKNNCNVPRLMIVGSGSGCGKTTVTCGLLKSLIEKHITVTAFKCGPDYIDPMFHSKVIGAKSRNLDAFLLEEDTLRYLFADNCRNSDLAIIEGVMGMYDGLGFDSDTYSSNHIARIIDAPQVLVINVKGKSLSVAAEIYGYMNFAQNNLKGVILNKCSEAMYPYYKNTIENKLNIKVFGYLPDTKSAEIGSRHLGLITADEIKDLKERMGMLGEVCNSSLDINGLIELAKTAPSALYSEIKINKIANNPIKIGVARDNAFCFYYEDSLKLLERLGAELVYFSPLTDKQLPYNLSGLILGGGYPEENVKALSENIAMTSSIKNAVLGGLPTYAECGGFMYLGKSIRVNGTYYPMTGVLDTVFHMTDKLVRFGYGTLTAKQDTILCPKSHSIRCHEFHYSDGSNCGDAFSKSKQSGSVNDCGFASKSLTALYPHLHFWSNPEFAESFVLKCINYSKEMETCLNFNK